MLELFYDTPSSVKILADHCVRVVASFTWDRRTTATTKSTNLRSSQCACEYITENVIIIPMFMYF